MIVLIPGIADAQQTPVYSQYFLNPYLYNPAMAGYTGDTKMFFLYRNQWSGIDGAPETQVLTLDGKLKDRPLGFGLSVFNDVTNIIGRTNVGLSASYTVSFTETQSLAFGLSAQGLQSRIYFDRIRADNSNDPALLTAMDNKTALEMNAGLNYTNGQLQLGLAADQLLQNTVDFEEAAAFRSVTFNYVRHYLASLRYRFKFAADWEVTPLLIARVIQGLPAQIDFNALFMYDERLWFGATYRHEIGMGYSLGMEVNDQLTFGYTYEMPFADLSSEALITHEFAVGLRISAIEKGIRSSGTGTGTPSKRRMKEYVTKDNLLQHEELDELRNRNRQVRQELEENKKLQERQQDEIRILNEKTALYEAELKALVANAQSEVGDLDKATRGDFYLVIASFKSIALAKAYQQTIRREAGLDSKIIQNSQKSFYLIWLKKFDLLDAARQERDNLQKSNMMDYVFGNPWIYRHKTGDE